MLLTHDVQKPPLTNRWYLGIAVGFFLTGCGVVVPDDLEISRDTGPLKDISFSELAFYLERADSAYDMPDEIAGDYPSLTYVNLLTTVDVLYFIEATDGGASQTIAVRGTASKANVLEDLEVALIPDSLLGIELHKGFQESAAAILEDALPHLDKNKPVRVTGHSLGGAISAVLAAYLDQEGYSVSRVVTFGQPRIATAPLSGKIQSVKTRVLNGPDIVPMVPPFSIFAQYRHFGPEVVLLSGQEYVYLNSHDSERESIGNIWRRLSQVSLNNHHVDEYAANIDQKISQGAVLIPYKQTN